MTRKAYRSHDKAASESFRKDPVLAAAYLSSVLEDGGQEELMLALRRVTDAYGGVTKIARNADLNTTTLYRTLSSKGNPELRSLKAILKAMDMRLAVLPARRKAA